MKAMLGLLILSLSLQARATASPQLQKIAQDIEATKANLEIQEVRQRQVLKALYNINKNLKKLVQEKGDLQDQKDSVEIQVENLENKMKLSQQQIQDQKAVLAQRLRAIYKLKGPTLIRFLFSAKSASDLDRNLKIMGLLTEHDLQLIKNFRQSLQELEERKHKLGLELAELQKVEKDILTSEEKLKQEGIQKNKILAGLKRTKLFTMDQLKNLKSRSLSYDLADSGLMDLLTRPSFEEQKGELLRPVQGPVLNRFGLVRSDSSYVLSNKGVMISASPGTPVRAVYGGVVAFVGTLPGIGKVLILDHGDHYYTVYGNNSEVHVKLGEEVKQAQVVAKSGRSGFDEQNGLYFEVRHFSEPYDPTEWVKGFSL